MILLLDEKISCEGLTASETDERIGCQTEQLIFDKITRIMFYENGGTEKSLTYFCPEII